MKGRRRVSRSVLVGLIALLVLAGTATAQESRVFVTSTSSNGNLGGLSGADTICQTRAEAGSLGGEWVAWLSTSTVDAKDRLTATGPFLRVGSLATIATNLTDLTDGSLVIPILLDEFTVQVGSTGVWTGTNSDGTEGIATCADWTTDSIDAVAGVTGSSASNTSNWTGGVAAPCGTRYRLYCFEQAKTVPTVPANALAMFALLLLAGGVAFLLRRRLAH